MEETCYQEDLGEASVNWYWMEPGRGMEADFCLGQATQVRRSAEGGDFSVKILRCHQEAWSRPGK